MSHSIVNIKKVLKGILLVLSLSLFLLPSNIQAQESTQLKSVTYFTGIGCPHCANVAPVLHEKVNADGDFLIVEYEIYQQTANAKYMNLYSNKYGSGLGIPLLFYDEPNYDLGDVNILKNFDSKLANTPINTFELTTGYMDMLFADLNKFEGKPKIYGQDRVAYQDTNKDLSPEENSIVRGFLLTQDLNAYVTELSGKKAKNLTIKLSGAEEVYDYGISIGSWNILWRGDAPQGTSTGNNTSSDEPQTATDSNISMLKVVGLALTDSINPCALSVLLMMLIAVTTYHPKDRKQILWSGLAFIAAVFITYFIYGLLIVKAFEVLQAFSNVRLYLYKGLAIGAIILGLLELKDFFFYKPGSVGTEMPLSLRPKVQNILARITSPLGAFGLGMFVTLFLLPCTIGPYIILGGMLSFGDFFKSIPILSLYNFIFVLPMIVIVFLVFFGTKDIKQISSWKERNIRIIHLVIGSVFILLGLAMLLGWI
ncbi:MAG: Cytochrome c biogenesis protein [candidate division WS6 bacterium GW2011_GWE1_34_7]|uniref:Cytochrome c biogenesis protein n=2 Tax=Candidatus Dojkabacteria TaxID=74243 RepID=A0A0G0B3W8_9BACT|nr:MAG: Cytochrome c biogenesis protein [candidate division WS6 bacterium GW2011_GWE1_34_7]KKP78213.1 MAG: Cytochrome c biogenesis protein [candidate division WS6 bacterium GW2011_GWF1_35_23]